MSKRNYKITRASDGWFKVQVWNDYGHYSCIYEKDLTIASKYIIDYWEDSSKCKRPFQWWVLTAFTTSTITLIICHLTMN